MEPDQAKEIRALLDDLQSKLVRGEMEEPTYLALRSRAEEELRVFEEEAERERAEAELRLWKNAMGALLLAGGTLLFLATGRILASGTRVEGPTPESSTLVFLQWFSVVPWAAGALLLFRRPEPRGEPVEVRWTFPADPEEARRVLRAVLERRSDRVAERAGWMECGLGRGAHRTRLALYVSGSASRAEVRVEARLGAGTGPGLLRDIREEAGRALRARSPSLTGQDSAGSR